MRDRDLAGDNAELLVAIGRVRIAAIRCARVAENSRKSKENRSDFGSKVLVNRHGMRLTDFGRGG